MRRALRWLLPVLAVLLFLLGGGTVRRVCAEAQYPFQRASGWARGQVTQRLAAAWRGLCDGPARLDAEAEAANKPIEVDVVRREKKPRPHKKG